MLLNTSSWQYLPEHINPIAFNIGPVHISWYGLMYLIAFAIVYFLVRYRIRTEKLGISLETVEDFFPWAILGLLLGARFGDVLIYDWPYFKNHLSQIFLPFDIHNHWQYIGIHGMSYFGGLIGLIIAFYIFCQVKISSKKPSPLNRGEMSRSDRGVLLNYILAFSDLFAPAIPLAFAFGRLGNFLNGELYGRVTTEPWGMYFPADLMGQLRHPSQLYEMFLEGILLFLILWSIRKMKFPVGYLTAFYLIGYGLARFISEFFREPDNGWFFLSLTVGQWFSVGIIAFGLFIIIKNRAARPM